MSERRKIETVEDAESLTDVIEGVVEGWYPPGTRMDTHDFLDRVEGHEYDLGSDLSSPAIVKILKIARKMRSSV